MTQTDKEREAYRLDGRTIHKNPVVTKVDGGESIKCGFPVCTVSEWVDAETVKAIFEENETRTQPQGSEVVERVEQALISALAKHGRYKEDDGKNVTIVFDYGEITKAVIAAVQHPTPPALTEEAGLERAAKYLEKKAEDFTAEHGSYDRSTNAWELSGAKEEYVGTLYELAEEIRALTAAMAKKAGV